CRHPAFHRGEPRRRHRLHARRAAAVAAHGRGGARCRGRIPRAGAQPEGQSLAADLPARATWRGGSAVKLASITTTLLLGALLTGCGGLLRNKEEPDRIYLLRAVPTPGAAAVPGVLAVPRPVVQPGLDTDRIMLTRNGQELDHFAAS